MSKLVKKFGGAFKKGDTFPQTKKALAAARATRPKRQAPIRGRARDVYTDPAHLGQPVPPPPVFDGTPELVRTLTAQRDAALCALSNRENTELLLDRFDRMIDRVEKGMERLQRALRVVIQVGEGD